MWVIDQNNYFNEVEGWDRGTQFGDGVFETIRIIDGLPNYFEYHCNRLSESLNKLSIKTDNVEQLILDYLKQFIDKTNVVQGVLKIIITRGSSARGYGFDNGIKAQVLAFYSNLPSYSMELYSRGVDLTFCETQCSIQSQLAGMKHLNRLENVLAKNELNGQFEGLMFNNLGYVIEGTMSNIFFENNNELFTPDLSLSGVNGVMRSVIIDHAKSKNINVNIVNIKKSEIESFQHAFICNSVMGIVPVNRLVGQDMSIGNMTQTLKESLNRGFNE